jgi:hypothetical protein
LLNSRPEVSLKCDGGNHNRLQIYAVEPSDPRGQEKNLKLFNRFLCVLLNCMGRLLRKVIFYDNDVSARNSLLGAFTPCFMDQVLELLLLTLPQRIFSRGTAFPARLHELRDVLDPRLPSGLQMRGQTAGTGLHGMLFRTFC